MIAPAEVAALVQSAADGAGAVAARWDVIVAAFLGGFSREVWKRRGEAVRLAALAEAAATAAVKAHADNCPAGIVVANLQGKR